MPAPIPLLAKFIPLGSLTTAVSDPGVTGRSAATIEALGSGKVILFDPNWASYEIMLRFRADGVDDDQCVLQLYATRGDDYFKIATFTNDQGTQTATLGGYYVDTITPSNEDVLFVGIESNITNSIGHYLLRNLGCSRFALVLTTLDSSTTTVYADAAFLYKP